MKSSPIHSLFILMVAAASAACGNQETTAPTTAQNSQLSTAGAGSDSSKTNPGKPAPGTPGDTATSPQTPPTPPPPDSGTSSPSYSGPVLISGKVLSYVTVVPSAASGDTLRLLPAAGASVTLINPSSGATVAHVTADGNGAFALPSVSAGTYKLQGQAAGSSRTSFMMISATQPTLTVSLYVNSTP